MPKKRSSPAQPAYAQVVEELRRRILVGNPGPGSRLPNEEELSNEFGVGRSTVREALSALASQNLIRTKRGVTGGSFVMTPTVDTMSAHLETGVGLMASAEYVSVAQLMEVRELLEVPTAGLAAHRINKSELSDLRAALSVPVGPLTGATQGSFSANHDFHVVLLRATGNPLLEVITAPVFRVLALRFGRERASNEFWDGVHKDHGEILDAIESRDSMAAMSAMRRHLDRLGVVYSKIDLLDHAEDD